MNGTGTYSFKSGDRAAVEPLTGGPLGYGTGTVTDDASADSAGVQALVKLTAAGTVSLNGH